MSSRRAAGVAKSFLKRAVELWGKKIRGERRCCLLTLDEKVWGMREDLSRELSRDFEEAFQELARGSLGRIYEEASRWAGSPEFGELAQWQIVFAAGLMEGDEEVLKISGGLSLRLSDVAESLAFQQLLGRSAVAHIFLYGSARFREEAAALIGKMGEEDYYSEVHDKKITKEVAPAIYAALSAINFVSSVADEEVEKDEVLRWISLSGGLKVKVVVQTGVGSAAAKALAARAPLEGLFLSILLGDALLFKMWPQLARLESLGDAAREAWWLYGCLRERLASLAESEGLRRVELFYDAGDAARDAAIAYAVAKAAEAGNLRELDKRLRILAR